MGRESTSDQRRALKQHGRAPAYARPQTRGDCVGGFRPCPFVGCRHHLFLEVSPAHSLCTHGKTQVADVEALAAMAETCSLDVADRGGIRLDEAARMSGFKATDTARAIERRGLAMLRQGQKDAMGD